MTLLIESRRLHIELLLKVALWILNVGALYIVIFDQLYLLLQHIFSIMNYF